MKTKRKMYKGTKKNFFIVSPLFMFFLLFFLYYGIKYSLSTERVKDYIFYYIRKSYMTEYTIILGICTFIFIAMFVIFIITRSYNLSIMVLYGIPLSIFCFFGFFIALIRIRGSAASYTNEIDNYLVYDKQLEKDFEIITKYVPNKEKVLKYEYTYVKGFRRIDFTMYIETKFEENVINEFNEDERLHIDLRSRNELSGYVIKEYDIYGETVLRSLILIIDRDNDKMIYAFTTSDYYVFSKSSNLYVMGFIDNTRTSPKYKYKQ